MLGTLGEPLKDPEYFRQVRVDDDLRTIVWPTDWTPRPNSCTAKRTPPRSSPSAQPRSYAAAPSTHRLGLSGGLG